MIIFTTKQEDRGPLFPTACPRCHSTVFFRLLKLRRWATFLWIIPLLPVKRAEYGVYCPVCELYYDVDDPGPEELTDMVDTTQEWVNFELENEAYIDEVVNVLGEWYHEPEEELRENLLASVGEEGSREPEYDDRGIQ